MSVRLSRREASSGLGGRTRAPDDVRLIVNSGRSSGSPRFDIPAKWCWENHATRSAGVRIAQYTIRGKGFCASLVDAGIHSDPGVGELSLRGGARDPGIFTVPDLSPTPPRCASMLRRLSSLRRRRPHLEVEISSNSFGTLSSALAGF